MLLDGGAGKWYGLESSVSHLACDSTAEARTFVVGDIGSKVEFGSFCHVCISLVVEMEGSGKTTSHHCPVSRWLWQSSVACGHVGQTWLACSLGGGVRDVQGQTTLVD